MVDGHVWMMPHQPLAGPPAAASVELWPVPVPWGRRVRARRPVLLVRPRQRRYALGKPCSAYSPCSLFPAFPVPRVPRSPFSPFPVFPAFPVPSIPRAFEERCAFTESNIAKNDYLNAHHSVNERTGVKGATRGCARAGCAASARVGRAVEPRAVETRVARATEPRAARMAEPRAARTAEPRAARAIEPRTVESQAAEPRAALPSTKRRRAGRGAHRAPGLRPTP